MNVRRIKQMAFIVAIFIPQLCEAQITVAAASDLQFAIQDIVVRFEKESGKTTEEDEQESGSKMKPKRVA